MPIGRLVGADEAVAAHHVDERVEVAPPRQVELAHRAWIVACTIAIGVCVEPGPGVPGDVAGDDPQQRAAVGGGEQGHLARAQVLVARRVSLSALRQVDPELEAVEQAAAGDQLLRRGLDVQDPAAGGHPLGVAVGDRAAATEGVLVVEDAVDDVGDGLEAAVRVPRRALGLTRRVVDLAHLVHVDERVESRRSTPANARLTGKPSPSKEDWALVTDTTGRRVERQRVPRPAAARSGR